MFLSIYRNGHLQHIEWLYYCLTIQISLLPKGVSNGLEASYKVRRSLNEWFLDSLFALGELKKEGIKLWKTGAKAFLVGDVMKDGVDFYKKFSQKPSGIDVSTKFVLCTIHRAENTDNFDRLTGILSALSVISKKTQIIINYLIF